MPLPAALGGPPRSPFTGSGFLSSSESGGPNGMPRRSMIPVEHPPGNPARRGRRPVAASAASSILPTSGSLAETCAASWPGHVSPLTTLTRETSSLSSGSSRWSFSSAVLIALSQASRERSGFSRMSNTTSHSSGTDAETLPPPRMIIALIGERPHRGSERWKHSRA